MSQKMLIEAIGLMDEEYIEEYFSYVPKTKNNLYRAIVVMAACLVMTVGVWMAMVWLGQSRTSDLSDGTIIAGKESEVPVISYDTVKPEFAHQLEQTQLYAQLIVPAPIIIASHPVTIELHVTEMPQNGENSIVPDEKDEESVLAVEKPISTDFTAWNLVENMMAPCYSGIQGIETKYYDYINGNVRVACAKRAIPDWAEDDQRLQGWIKNVVYYAPVHDNWYWFNTDALRWEDEYDLQTTKEETSAYSNILLMKEVEKLYIMQVKTSADSLEEANVLYPEEAFSNNIQVSYCNGMPMYLVENLNGELYVRFLVDDTLITMIDQGFGRECLMEMIKSVKQVPVIDWGY